MKIGVDFDGVILDSEKHLKFYADYYSHFELGGRKRIHNDSVIQQDCFDWTQKEIDVFFTKYFALATKTAPFICGAKEILQKLKSEGHKLYLITNRTVNTIDEVSMAKERLNELNIEFDGYSFENGNKPERCKKLGIDIMIDDTSENVKAFIGTNIKVLHFRDVNIKKVVADNVIDVDNWMKVYYEINNIKQ